MAEDTAAILEPDTAEVEPEAPPVEELPETEGGDTAPETADQDAPETDEASEPKTLTAEEHERILKAEIAKKEESFRRQRENAEKEAQDRAAQEAWTRNQQLASQQSEQQMLGTIYADMERQLQAGVEKPDLRNVVNTVRALSQNAQHRAYGHTYESLTAAFNTRWGDVDIPAEMAQRFHAAGVRYDVKAMTEAWLEAAAEAAVKKAEPELRKKWQAEQKAKAASAQKTEQIKQADEARAGSGRPTANLAGAAAGRRYSPEELQELLNTPSRWTALPKEDRKKILEERDRQLLERSRK